MSNEDTKIRRVNPPTICLREARMLEEREICEFSWQEAHPCLVSAVAHGVRRACERWRREHALGLWGRPNGSSASALCSYREELAATVLLA